MKLPKFLFDTVNKHKTSLGDNKAFPPEEDYPFDYKILKKRFNEVVEKAEKCDKLKSLDEKYLINLLSKLIKECKEKEKPFEKNLIKLCEDIVNETLHVPAETVNVNCELVEKIKPKNSFRLMPEKSEKREFDFEDLDDFDNVSKVILKRRLINSLVQGASYKLCELYKLKKSIIDKFDKTLVPLYNTIITINDYLLFIKKEKINDDKPMQGSCVEVLLGRNGDKTDINVQGLIFPFLLNELFRGYFELFASHGLPTDYKKANYILNQSDFLLAEPWDLRMGVGLWEIIGEDIDPIHLPFYFSKICEMPVDEFNYKIREIFANTKHGRSIKEDLKNESSHDFDMCKLTTTIQNKNAETSVLTDSYLSSDELDNYIIDSDNDSVIEEEDNDKDYLKLISTCSINNIDFEEEELDYMPQFQIHVIINGIKIPVNLVDFKIEPRNVLGEDLYQSHIFLDKSAQHMGLGYKIYVKAIMTYGNLYSGYGRRLNNSEIPRIWNKLSREPNINVSEVMGRNGKPIGIKATLKQ